MVEPVDMERDGGVDSLGVNAGEVKLALERRPSIKDMRREMRAAHV